MDGDEIPGDLDRRGGEPLEIAERGVAGPEVVDRDAASEGAQRLELDGRLRGGLEEGRPRPLEDCRGRPDPRRPDDLGDDVDEIGLLQLATGHVDADLEIAELRPPIMPLA